MAIVKLDQAFVTNNLICPDGRDRIEFCCSEIKGLYILVAAQSPGEGCYYLRYKDSNGKTCHQKIGRTADITLAGARTQAKGLRASIVLGANPRAEENARKAVLSLDEFFEKHYFPHAKVHKRSWVRDDQLYRIRIKSVFGSRKLNQITRQQIQVFHAGLLEEGLSPASCDHHVKLMKHAFNLAIDWGYLTEPNPASRVPLFNADNKVEHYLDDAELEKLLTVLRTDENRPVCMIALFLLSTGCRLNEALSATWSQFDRQARVWRIPAKNSKSKRIRSVPLNDSALEVLGQLDTEGRFSHLFVNKQTGEPYTTIMKVWERLRNKAGLPHLRIHDLRHQYASFLVNAGRTIYEVQQILGHSDPSVTQRYAHLSSKTLQDAANSASVIIKGAMKVKQAA